ncbi:MAG TPA: RNA polymerase sigma factor, partial [Longimicrobiales bacterium]|nr:RNA polymerase sigma factor [Longimicrobiales bacterium]
MSAGPTTIATAVDLDVDRLFRLHHVELFRYLVRFTGDETLAADGVQHAFLRLMEVPPEPRQVRAWLYRVATNWIRDHARAERRREQLLARHPGRVPVGEPDPPPDRLFERRRAEERVRAALDELDERDRTLLLLRQEGFTQREIA